MEIESEQQTPIFQAQRSLSISAESMDYPVGRDALPPVKIFYHPSMEKLARKIVNLVEQTRLTAKEKLRSVQSCKQIRWEKFKDGWPNLFIDDVRSIGGKDVIFLANFASPDLIFEQLSLAYSFPRYFVRSFRLILPFFPTGTMERIDFEGQIVTAKTLSTMLSVIPLAARGPAQIFIFDIHALQERFYFSDQVIPRLLTALPHFMKELEKLTDANNLTIAFPDEGAQKRFHMYIPNRWPLITCIKVRDGDNRTVKIKEGISKDRHVIIIDDLVQTGGTLIECAKALKREGATAISMYVTHAVFPNKSWRKFTAEDSDLGLSNFWITDSIPHAIDICQHKPFKLLSLAQDLVDALLAYDLLKGNN